MSKRFLLVSSALGVLAMTILFAEPAFGQRGGRGGGGGNRGGGGGSRQWSGGNQYRSSDRGQAGAQNRSNSGRSWRSDDWQQRERQRQANVSTPLDRNSQRSYQRDGDRWTPSNQYGGYNRSRSQWDRGYSNQWSQRNSPNYGGYNRYGNYGRYGSNLGLYGNNLGMYGNSYVSPYGGDYGNYYGNRAGLGLGYGYGISSLIGMATGLGGYGGVGGFGIPAVGFGYGGYGAYGPLGYNRGYYSNTYPRPYIAGNVASGASETYVSTPAQSSDFLKSGRTLFLAGNYADAQKQAEHAVVEMPDNPKTHELMMLSMFAQGDYEGATAAAHAVADLGKVPDWPTLYGYYKDRDKYVQHLDKLRQFVKGHPETPEARFLLGFNYQMLGDKTAAQKQFREYLEDVGREDQIAVRMFRDLGGDVSTLPMPETVPVTAPESAEPATSDRTN